MQQARAERFGYLVRRQRLGNNVDQAVITPILGAGRRRPTAVLAGGAKVDAFHAADLLARMIVDFHPLANALQDAWFLLALKQMVAQSC